MKQLFTFLFLGLFFFSCEDAEVLTSDDVNVIRYGTSFGECLGYCKTDLEVSAAELYYVAYGWNNSVTPEMVTREFNAGQYSEMLSKVDQEAFLSLDPVIGCPDCADGGSEWIELTIDGRVKTVTFEYGKEIEGIADLIKSLRELVSQVEK